MAEGEIQITFRFCEHLVSLNTDSSGTKSSKPALAISLKLNLFCVNRKWQAADIKYLDSVHYLRSFLLHSKESIYFTIKLFLIDAYNNIHRLYIDIQSI